MSATQRLVPLLVAATVGCVSGAYIFDPLLREYVAAQPAAAAPGVAAQPPTSQAPQAPRRTIAEEGRAELRELAAQLQRKSEDVKERAGAHTPAPAAAAAAAAAQAPPQPNSAAPQKQV